MSRAVLPGVAHHVTQRGVDRQDVFYSDAHREVYFRLAAWAMPQFGVRVLAYCMMSNHVHWVVTPESPASLARAFGWLHGRYAQHLNADRVRSGHLWQNRFFSCALDEAHMWAAIRYVERNPVRAGIVEQAGKWRWSSAPARLGLATSPIELDLAAWSESHTIDQWKQLLAADSMQDAELRLRLSTYTGRPAGAEEFVVRAEARLNRKLAARKGGRPKKDASTTSPSATGQATLFAGGAA